MNELNDLNKFFSEQEGKSGEGNFDADQYSREGDMGLLQAIWKESEKLSGYESFDSDRAYQKLADQTTSRNTARVLNLRTGVVAVAAGLLILLIAGRYLIQSPAQEPALSKDFTSFAEARDYAEANLFAIAEKVMAEARSAEFRDRVVEMAGERFDGESNVLIANVLAANASDIEWQEKLDAFRDIDGSNFYPQVFIPDYDTYREKSGEPCVVIHVTDEPTQDGQYIYDSYKLDDEGELSFYKRVSDSDVEREKIWVFSLNENVDDDGRRLSNRVSLGSDPGTLRGRIGRMRVSSPKESWAGGASEVHIKAVLEYWNGLNYRGEAMDVPCDRSTFTPRGMPVRVFSRQEINQGTMVELDYHLHDNWEVDNFMEDEVAYVYVLFESDVWPNGYKQASFNLPSGEERVMEYSSAQPFYDLNVVFGIRSPEGWQSAVYPNGIPETQLIDRFVREGSDEIFYNTEVY